MAFDRCSLAYSSKSVRHTIAISAQRPLSLCENKAHQLANWYHNHPTILIDLTISIFQVKAFQQTHTPTVNKCPAFKTSLYAILDTSDFFKNIIGHLFPVFTTTSQFSYFIQCHLEMGFVSLHVRQIAAGTNSTNKQALHVQSEKLHLHATSYSFKTYHKWLIFHKQKNKKPLSLSHDTASAEDWGCNIAALTETPLISANAVQSKLSTTHQSSFCTLTSEQLKWPFDFLVFLFSYKNRLKSLCLWRSLRPQLCFCVDQNQTFIELLWKPLTDSVCDLIATPALIVFTQAGNVLMVTPTIVRTRGVWHSALWSRWYVQ